MMAEVSKKNKPSSWGVFQKRPVCVHKNMMLKNMENTRNRKECQQSIGVNMKRKRTDCDDKPLSTSKLVKKLKSTNFLETLNSENGSNDATVARLEASDQNSQITESWEVDSGFSSEASPPASGRSSPCPTTVVALDCEMVGTGPGGRCSELARCSILDYHGNILYDKYVRPCQPVTDFRTRWSGIQRHHLHKATSFSQARDEIISILEGRVVVGHSVYNDFAVLHIPHPCHMVRDTSTSRHLSRLAVVSKGRCPSLKILASKLLNRQIQVGKRGHCSVEDARAALDLYKLVEGEWEQEVQNKLRDKDAPHGPSFASSDHYMHDEYWPDDDSK